jgi:hypothetical protein
MANEYNDIFVVPLSDGRLQFFAIDTNFQIWSQWKQTTDPNSGWTQPTEFATPGNGAVKITGAPLPDKRVQLFATDVDRVVWSCWKSSTDPNSGWTEWTEAWF